MEVVFDKDNEDEQIIFKQGKDIGYEDGDGNLYVQVFLVWNVQQIEDQVVNISVVEVSYF